MRRALRSWTVAAVVAEGAWAAAPVPPPPSPPESPAAPRAAAATEPAWLGIVFGDALDGGVQVVAVVPGGPADQGGVREGDVLLAIGDRSTADRAAVLDVVRLLRPGQEVAVRLIRAGRIATAELRPTDARRREFPLFGLGAPGLGRPTPFAADGGGSFAGFESARIPRELRVHYGAPADAGVLVVSVEPQGPGARAGIRVGDVVVKIAGRSVDEPLDVVREFARARSAPLELNLVRARKAVVLRIAAVPPVPATRDAERLQLEAEQDRLRRELARVEAEIERLRGLER